MAENWDRATVRFESASGKLRLENILHHFFYKNFAFSEQDALVERLGKNSVPFLIEIGSITPPSVQLLPAKRYTGAPIGTSYDIRVYTGNLDKAEIKCH